MSLLLRDPVAMGPVEEEKKGKRLRPEHLEDSTEEPKHAPRPGQLPLCLSRAGSLSKILNNYFAARSKYNTSILQENDSSLCSSFLASVGMESLVDKRLNIIGLTAFYHDVPGIMPPCYEMGIPQPLNHPY